VPDVVRADLQLEAVGGRAVRRDHDAGVVHEHVDPVVPRAQLLDRPPDVGEVGQVERQHLDVDVGQLLAQPGERVVGLLRVPRGDGQARAGPPQLESGVEPEPSGDTGDDGPLPAQVGDVLRAPAHGTNRIRPGHAAPIL
jgi:hypothetical protein